MRNNKTAIIKWGAWDAIPQVKEEWDLMIAHKIDEYKEAGKTDGTVVTSESGDGVITETRVFTDNESAEAWAGWAVQRAQEVNKPVVSFKLAA